MLAHVQYRITPLCIVRSHRSSLVGCSVGSQTSLSLHEPVIRAWTYNIILFLEINPLLTGVVVTSFTNLFMNGYSQIVKLYKNCLFISFEFDFQMVYVTYSITSNHLPPLPYGWINFSARQIRWFGGVSHQIFSICHQKF